MDYENEDKGFHSAQERVGAALSGVFLFFFGFPFTLVPFMILPEVCGESMMLNIFVLCFSLPFLCAGLLVQTAGCISLIMALFPESKFTVKQLLKRREASTSREHYSDHHPSPSYAEEYGVAHQEKPIESGNFWDNVAEK